MRDDKGRPTEIFFCDGKDAHLYNFDKRDEFVCEIPAGYPESHLSRGFFLGGIARLYQQRIQWVYFGFPVAEMRKRYRFRLTKEDAAWAYIEVEPDTKEERAGSTFEKLQVVLDRKTNLVQRLWFLEPGQESTLDFKRIDPTTDHPVSLESMSEGLPKGWTRTGPAR